MFQRAFTTFCYVHNQHFPSSTFLGAEVVTEVEKERPITAVSKKVLLFWHIIILYSFHFIFSAVHTPLCLGLLFYFLMQK